MRTLSFLSLSALALFGLTACPSSTERSDQVVQDNISQIYSVHYDKSLDTTSVRAKFGAGPGKGVSLRLVGKSQILHNLYLLRETKELGTSYLGEGRGFLPNHMFSFVDTDGKHFTNGITFSPAEFGEVPETAKRDADLRLSWQGPPLGEREWITVYLRSQGPKGELTFEKEARKGSTALVLSAKALGTLPQGPATLEIHRRTEISLQQKTSRGGFLRGEYVGAKRTILLK